MIHKIKRKLYKNNLVRYLYFILLSLKRSAKKLKMPNLKDQVAVVTGSGRGIGKATSLLLAKQGCNLVLISRTKKELEETKKEIEKLGRKALIIPMDVSDYKEIKNAVRKAIERFGRIDILVNNAGVAYDVYVKDTSKEILDRTVDINFKGLFLMSKECLQYLEKSNGVIVNISSVAGKRGYEGGGAYCASKFAVIGFTEALSQETKIKVYAICPGATDTKMLKELYPDMDTALMAKPEDVAKVILDAINGSQPSGSSIIVR